jgi:hypothetical protein
LEDVFGEWEAVRVDQPEGGSFDPDEVIGKIVTARRWRQSDILMTAQDEPEDEGAHIEVARIEGRRISGDILDGSQRIPIRLELSDNGRQLTMTYLALGIGGTSTDMLSMIFERYPRTGQTPDSASVGSLPRTSRGAEV